MLKKESRIGRKYGKALQYYHALTFLYMGIEKMFSRFVSFRLLNYKFSLLTLKSVQEQYLF